jgi:hypothetical protein
MRRTVTVLAAAATIAAATVAAPDAANAGGRDWWGPAIIGGIAAGIVVGSQIARPQYPGPVYFEYSQPGPTYYEVYPPQYFGPAPIDNCWRWRHGHRQRVC